MNYDIDVPLFLPLYARNRLRDFRTIALREQKQGTNIDGEVSPLGGGGEEVGGEVFGLAVWWFCGCA